MNRLGRWWRAFAGLSRQDRATFLRALFLLPLTVAALRILGFRRTMAFLATSGASPPRPANLPVARSLACIVERAGPWSALPANCLPRALVLLRLLRLRGLAAELRIGVAKPGETLAAHAWVEHGGVPLAQADETLAAYARFDQSDQSVLTQ